MAKAEKQQSVAQPEGGSGTLADAYEKTRKELNEALNRLREQLARLDTEAAAQRARDWVAQNPALALLIALGAGVVTGRLIALAVEPAPPPLRERARRSAAKLARKAQKEAKRLRRQLSKQMSALGETVADRARTLQEELPDQAAVLAERVREQAEALSKALAQQASAASETLEEAARHTSKRVKRVSQRGLATAEALLSVAATAAAAATLKKLNDWMRRIG